MNAMRIVEKPHIKSLSGLDLETSSVPLSSIPPNTHTPLKHIRERWHQSLSLRGPSRIIPNTSALSTTLQSTLVPGSAGPPDFSDISAVGSRFERQGTEPDAAREAMPRQKTWKNPLRPWNPNGFMGVFFTNQEKGVPISKLLNFKPLPSSAISNAANGASERETTLGQKRMLKLQDKLSAVNDSLRRSGSLSVFEDDVGHVGDEMPQEIQRIATAAKAQSPKLAKRRLPGEDQADPQPEKRRTRHDPLDDLYELALTSPNIHIPRKKRAPQVTLKDNPPKQDNPPTQQDKFVLSEWFVKGVENKGVCVEGKRVDCEDLYWHSNIIVHRIEPYKVQSLTGRVYELKGHVDKACMLEAGCPSWLVGKFKLGFPDNWKSYVNSFLKSPIMPNQPKDPPSKDQNNVTKDAKKATSCPNTKGKQPSNSNKKLLRMQDPEHPDGEHGSKDRPSHSNPSTQCGTTRSGRQVKPILKYWCGERISVDFELNTKVIRPDKDTRTDSFDRVRGSISGRSHGKGSSSKSPSSKRKMQNKEELPVKKTNSKSQTLRTGQRNVKRSPLKPMSVRLSPLNNRQQMKKRCLQHRVRCRSLSHSNSPPKVSLRKTDMGYKKSQADKTENNKATSSFPQDTDKCETGTLAERRSSSDILIISDDESDDCLAFTKKKGNKSKKASEIPPESFKTSVQPTVHPTEPQNCVRSSERLKRKNSWSKGHVIEMQKETLCDQFPSTKLPSGSPVFLTNIAEASEDRRLTGSKGPPHLQTKVNSDLSNTSRTQTLGTEQPITDSGKPPDLENVAVLCENTSKQTVRKKHKATLQKSSKQKTKRVKPYSSKLQSSLTESQDSEEEAKAKVSRQVPDSQKKSTLSKPTRERNPVVESSLSEVSSPLNSVPGKQRPLNSKKDNKQASHYTQPLDDLEKESSQNKALEQPCDKVAVPSGKSKSSSDLEESEVETVSRKDLSKKVKSKNKRLLSTPGPQKRQNTNSQKSQEQAIEQENAEKRFTGKKIATKRSHSRACQRKSNLSEETSESELDFAEEDDQEDYKSERKARGKATKPSNQLRNLRKRRQILSSSSASEKLDRKSENDLDSESEEMVPGKDLRQSAKSKNKLLVSTPGPQKIRSQKSQRRAKEKENTEKHFTEINDTNKQTNRSSRKKKSSPSETSPSELDVAGEEEEKSEEDCKPKRKTKTKVGSKATKPSPLQDLQKPQQNLKNNNASRPSTHSNPEGQLPKNPFAVHQEDGTEKEVKRLCRKSQNDDLNSESEEEVVPGKHLRQSAKSKNKLLVSTPGPQKRRNTRSQKSQRRAIEQENTEKHFTEINDTNKPTNRSSRKKKSSPSETSPSELDVADEEEEKSEEDCEPKRKTKTKVSRRATKPSPLQDLQKPQQNVKDDNASRPSTHSNPERQLPKNPFAVHQEDWTEKEVKRLYSAIYTLPKYKRGFWNDVAMAVGNRSAEECQEKYMDNQQFKGSKSKPKKKNCPSKKKKENKGKDMVQITAKVGTLKRKRQMREFLDQMQKDDHDDLFSSTPFRNKRVRLPSMMHNTEDDNFHLDAQSPSSSSGIFPLAYTPESNHISPGMLGTINRSDNEKYVYRLQKSLKHPQFRVFINKKTGHKIQATPTSRRLTTLGKGSRDTSVIAKLFEPNESNNSDEEEKDYYFSNSFSDEN